MSYTCYDKLAHVFLILSFSLYPYRYRKMLTPPNLFESIVFRHFVCCKNQNNKLAARVDRTNEWRIQSPLLYHLATGQCVSRFGNISFFCQRVLFPVKTCSKSIDGRFYDNIGKSCFFKNLFISSRKNSFVPQAISFSKGNKLSYDQSFHGSSQT